MVAASDDRNRTDVLKALFKSTARVEYFARARGTKITATVECNTASVPSVVVVITSRW